MEPSDSIGRLGFSRWYERRLIQSHAWFVTAFACVIMVAVWMEELTFRGSAARGLAYAALVVGALAFGAYGMYRYQKILFEAERIGERATCPACGVYARFRLVAGIQACCRKCSHEWRLID